MTPPYATSPCSFKRFAVFFKQFAVLFQNEDVLEAEDLKSLKIGIAK
jgi:hypothetical protein